MVKRSVHLNLDIITINQFHSTQGVLRFFTNEIINQILDKGKTWMNVESVQKIICSSIVIQNTCQDFYWLSNVIKDYLFEHLLIYV